MIRQVPGSTAHYHLLSFDKEGREQRVGNALGSVEALREMRGTAQPVTDVFLISHGWKGDVPAAIQQYDDWTGVMAGATADLARMRAVRPEFHALIVGLHWPSQPWGDEDGSARAFDAGEAPDLDAQVDAWADRIADTPAARAALRVILTSAEKDILPASLPPNVVEAYQVLDGEARVGSDAPGGDGDREPFDPEQRYQDAIAEEVAFDGGGLLEGILSPLRQLSFWTMKKRARSVGESGFAGLLRQLQQADAAKGVRFHVMGHSFGCITTSAMIAGTVKSPPIRSVDTLFLVQGALSLWAYCSAIPEDFGGGAGMFNPLLAGKLVKGPIVTTQSTHDRAVGTFYPIGAGVARQVAFDRDLPKYGGVGTWGIRGEDAVTDDRTMPLNDLAVQYGFSAGKVYNVSCDDVICEGGGASGAHSDIVRPEVAHAFWDAILHA